jgi:hypothetical protein
MSLPIPENLANAPQRYVVVRQRIILRVSLSINFYYLGLTISLHISSNLTHASFIPIRLPNASAAGPGSVSGSVISLEACLEEFCRGELLEEVECPHCSAELTRRELAARLVDLEEIQRLSAAVDISEEIESVRVSLSALTEALSQGQSDALSLDLDKPLSLSTTRNINTPSTLRGHTDSPSESINSPIRVIGESSDEHHENGLALSHSDNTTEDSDKSPLEGSLNRFDGNDVQMAAGAEGAHSAVLSPDPQPSEVLIDPFFVKKVRTSVRKRMFISRPSQLLCLHICRRVPCMLTGRMKKLSHHVNFPLRLDMTRYFRAGGQGDSDTNTTQKSAEAGSRRKIATFRNSIDRYNIGSGLGGRLGAMGSANNSNLQYDLKAVIQHTGSADSGRHRNGL